MVWLVIVKGGINTRASARYEFGLGALSSHAASQSPSTIRGVPAVWEGRHHNCIKRRMGVTYGVGIKRGSGTTELRNSGSGKRDKTRKKG